MNAPGPWAARDLVHVIIDTPSGSRNKYKLDEASGLFKLSRVLPAGLHFPCDFGFVPGTRGEDGDALDVAVLSDGASFVGCLMTVRVIGLIRASQTEKGRNVQNDRLLGVPVTPVNRPVERDIAQIGQERLRAIEQFFISYNAAQGRTLRLQGRRGAAAARRALAQGIERRS